MNLLFIQGESHAPGMLGVTGNPVVKTPNLDELAGRGTLFETTYCASPLCVPARAAVATGRFPHESGFWESSMAFDGSIDSWMRRLREAGHKVAGIGKMHFRSNEDDNGFSREIDTMHIADGVGDLIGALRYGGHEPVYERLWKLWTSQYGVGDAGAYRKYDERIVERAIDWLKNVGVESERPWALSVHFVAAHAPFIIPQRFHDLYHPDEIPPPVQFEKYERPRHPAIEHLRRILAHTDDLSIDQIQAIRAAYYATITYLDEQIGRLLDALEEFGLSEKTWVIYTSDHGFSCGDHYILGLFHLYEDTVAVPLIMAGPELPRGVRVSDPVSHVDLYPTILEGFQVELTGEERGFEGSSLWPVIEGRGQRQSIFAEYHGCGTSSGGFVLREQALKLIYFVGMAPQLFDLSTDPHETNDLAQDEKNSHLVAGMMEKLYARVDPKALDEQAKAAQRTLIERHGGAEKVIRERGDFAYSPPPGMDWKTLADELT